MIDVMKYLSKKYLSEYANIQLNRSFLVLTIILECSSTHYKSINFEMFLYKCFQHDTNQSQQIPLL